MRSSAVFLVFVVLFAACGGDDEADGVASLDATTTVVTTATEPAEEVDQEQAAIALIECLREGGLEVDDPTVDADGNVQFPQQDLENPIDQDELETALEGCEEELQAVVIGFTRDFDFTALQDTLLEYSACMRDNGFDLPDPDFSNLGFDADQPPTGPFGDVDFNDPDFVEANEACDDLLSGLGFGG